jgi:opacity protein-like surface antigen
MKGISTLIGACILLLSSIALAGGQDVANAQPTDEPPITPPPAIYAMTGFYFGLHTGVAIPGGDSVFENEAKTGFGVGGQAGYKYGNYRFEGGIDYFRNTFRSNTNAHSNMMAYMSNIYYDFPWSGSFQPIIGFGLGIVDPWETITTTATARHVISGDVKFAYQGMIGLAFRCTSHFVVDFRYRIFGWGGSDDAYMHILEAGVSYYL